MNGCGPRRRWVGVRRVPGRRRGRSGGSRRVWSARAARNSVCTTRRRIRRSARVHPRNWKPREYRRPTASSQREAVRRTASRRVRNRRRARSRPARRSRRPAKNSPAGRSRCSGAVSAETLEEGVAVASVEWAVLGRSAARSDKIAFAGAAREGAQGAQVCALCFCAPWLAACDSAVAQPQGIGRGRGWGRWRMRGLRILGIIGRGD